MTSTETRWSHILPYLTERAYATIDAQPESLLECDGGPVGMTAHVVLARLIGPDDQIIQDGLRLQHAEPMILKPVPQRLSLATGDYDPFSDTLRTMRYALQSNYATYQMGAEFAPADVVPDFQTRMFTVLFLRYRRRL